MQLRTEQNSHSGVASEWVKWWCENGKHLGTTELGGARSVCRLFIQDLDNNAPRNDLQRVLGKSPWWCWPDRREQQPIWEGHEIPYAISYLHSPTKRLTLWEEVQEHHCSWSPDVPNSLWGREHSLTHYPGGVTAVGFLSRIITEWGEEAAAMRPRETGRGSTGTCMETEPAWFEFRTMK